MAWWRVQSTWTVGDEPRRYAPIFRRTRVAAMAARGSMRRTLRHIPTLEVHITRVSAEDRAVEEAALAEEAGPLPTIHMRVSREAPITACGRSGDEVEIAHEPWLFGYAVTGVDPGDSKWFRFGPDRGRNPDWRERDPDRICAGCLETREERFASALD